MGPSVQRLFINHLKREQIYILNSSETNDTPVPFVTGVEGLKEYYCPFCSKFLFKGNVKKINMVCHHCQKLVDASESELVRSKTDEE